MTAAVAEGLREQGAAERKNVEGAIRKVLIKEEEHLMMFDMVFFTDTRTREIYTLTRDQASLPKATIFLEKTKNGDKRQVPISSELAKGLW